MYKSYSQILPQLEFFFTLVSWVPNRDQDQVNYLLKGLSTVLDTPCNLLVTEPQSLDASAVFDSTFAAVRSKLKPSKLPSTNQSGASSSSASGPERLGEADIQKRIAAVLDMFPELGDGKQFWVLNDALSKCVIVTNFISKTFLDDPANS